MGRSEGKKTHSQAASEGGCSEGWRKETQHWISSMGSRSQAVVKCKGFIANVFLDSHELTSSPGEKWLHESLGWNVEVVLLFTQKTELSLSVELLYQISIKCPPVWQSCSPQDKFNECLLMLGGSSQTFWIFLPLRVRQLEISMMNSLQILQATYHLLLKLIEARYLFCVCKPLVNTVAIQIH